MSRAAVLALAVLAACARPVPVPAPAPVGQLTPAETAERDARFAAAWKDVKGYLVFGPVVTAPAPPTWAMRRELAGASERLRDVIALDPGWWASWWALGKVYQRLERPGDAATCFGRALALAPPEALAPIASDAGASARQAGDLDAAIRFYEIATRAAPDDAGPAANLALVHLAAGHVAVARRIVEAALARSPDDPGLRRALARVEERELGRSAGVAPGRPGDAAAAPPGALRPTLAPLLVPPDRPTTSSPTR